jgi:hypothetical protein
MKPVNDMIACWTNLQISFLFILFFASFIQEHGISKQEYSTKYNLGKITPKAFTIATTMPQNKPPNTEKTAVITTMETNEEQVQAQVSFLRRNGTTSSSQ